MQNRLKVLIACEESQRVCKEFRLLDHEAYSCDLQQTSGDRPEWHIQADCLDVIDGDCSFVTQDGEKHNQIGEWDLIIGHPPCTYLTNGGAVRMFRRETREYKPYGTFQMVNVDRLRKGIKARDLFVSMFNAKCRHIAIENPVPMSIYCMNKSNQIIQPYMFGDPYSKKTCLWLKGLPQLEPTDQCNTYHPYINGGVEGLTDRITKGRNSRRDRCREAKHFLVLRKQWQNSGVISYLTSEVIEHESCIR